MTCKAILSASWELQSSTFVGDTRRLFLCGFPGSQESPYGDTQTEGFDWKRQWYPVAVVRDLEAMDPREPYPVKVEGRHCVLVG